MDKNRPTSKYECLAKLINTSKPFDSYSLLKQKPLEVQCEDKSEQIDNNNKISNIEHVNPIKSIQIDNQTKDESNEIEKKIVENEQKNIKSIDNSDIDDENTSTSPSNSSNSFDSTEKADLAINHESKSSENNNSLDQKLQEQQQQSLSMSAASASPNDVNDSQIDSAIDKNDENSESDGIANSLSLDVNENKSDIKLKYAEVVKMDGGGIDHCVNTNFDPLNEPQPLTSPDNIDRTKSTKLINSQVDLSSDELIKTINSDKICEIKKVSSPKPIHATSHRCDEQIEEMSPICKIRLPLNSPRLVKTKDIMNELPLTPDSTHSLDSSGEYPTPFDIKSIAPERSFSSESLNSETSIESNDSKSSIKLTAAKFSKNGTLERQSNSGTINHLPTTNPCGLQVLMLWNNNITRESAHTISDLLSTTTTLEILNVGKNVLSNDFITNIKTSLKSNTCLTSLGLQSAHLSNDGIKTLSEILDFGGNVTLQRVDLRDNNLQVSGLGALNEVLKSNKSITRIDLDDVPRRTVSTYYTYILKYKVVYTKITINNNNLFCNFIFRIHLIQVLIIHVL